MGGMRGILTALVFIILLSAQLPVLTVAQDSGPLYHTFRPTGEDCADWSIEGVAPLKLAYADRNTYYSLQMNGDYCGASFEEARFDAVDFDNPVRIYFEFYWYTYSTETFDVEIQWFGSEWVTVIDDLDVQGSGEDTHQLYDFTSITSWNLGVFESLKVRFSRGDSNGGYLANIGIDMVAIKIVENPLLLHERTGVPTSEEQGNWTTGGRSSDGLRIADVDGVTWTSDHGTYNPLRINFANSIYLGSAENIHGVFLVNVWSSEQNAGLSMSLWIGDTKIYSLGRFHPSDHLLHTDILNITNVYDWKHIALRNLSVKIKHVDLPYSDNLEIAIDSVRLLILVDGASSLTSNQLQNNMVYNFGTNITSDHQDQPSPGGLLNLGTELLIFSSVLLSVVVIVYAILRRLNPY